MDQHTLRQAPGAKRPRKRVGRGNAAGGGTYAGRGLKGQKARSGGKVRIGFEGGQMPIMRRLGHRRGFRNPTRIEFQAVNLAALEQNFEAGARVDAEALAALRLIEDASQPFKVLARGELTRPLTVVAPRLSGAAKQAISDAGGSFEELAPAEHRVRNRVHRRKAAAATSAEANRAVEPAPPADEAPPEADAADDGEGAEA